MVSLLLLLIVVTAPYRAPSVDKSKNRVQMHASCMHGLQVNTCSGDCTGTRGPSPSGIPPWRFMQMRLPDAPARPLYSEWRTGPRKTQYYRRLQFQSVLCEASLKDAMAIDPGKPPSVSRASDAGNTSATRFTASCAVRLGRYPNDPSWKSASKIGFNELERRRRNEQLKTGPTGLFHLGGVEATA
jgi:hypothetical protein